MGRTGIPKSSNGLSAAAARGNALFLILIAIALFAALSYAITSTGRGDGLPDKEQAALDAAQMLSYVAQLQTAISRLTITGGCAPDMLSFKGMNVLNTQTNPRAPADGSCDLFLPAGAGLAAIAVPPGAQLATEPYPGYLAYEANNFTGLAWPGATEGYQSANLETTVTVRNVTLPVCNAINRGLQRGWAAPPLPVCNTSHRPVPYNTTPGIENCFDTPELRTLDSFCYKRTGATEAYDFTSVLIAR